MFKIIIFDFDGTIADTNKCIIETFQQSLVELGFDTMEEKDISRLIGLPLTHMYAQLLHTDDKSLIDTAVATYRRLFTPISERTVTLFPHVAETLRQIHESDISTAIATSRGRDSLRMLLKVHDIAQYIDTDCCEEDVTNKKPAPDMVERILNETGFDAKDALVVGDTWFDIQMGRDAGCTTCGVTYGNHSRATLLEHGADHIIDDFAELKSISSFPKIF